MSSSHTFGNKGFSFILKIKTNDFNYWFLSPIIYFSYLTYFPRI